MSESAVILDLNDPDRGDIAFSFLMLEAMLGTAFSNTGHIKTSEAVSRLDSILRRFSGMNILQKNSMNDLERPESTISKMSGSAYSVSLAFAYLCVKSGMDTLIILHDEHALVGISVLTELDVDFKAYDENAVWARLEEKESHYGDPRFTHSLFSDIYKLLIMDPLVTGSIVRSMDSATTIIEDNPKLLSDCKNYCYVPFKIKKARGFKNGNMR